MDRRSTFIICVHLCPFDEILKGSEFVHVREVSIAVLFPFLIINLQQQVG
jgi:hypothetical protein